MSEKAIVHDLDAMARVGLAGFHFYGGDRSTPQGVEKCRFVLREAAKRGLRASIVIGSAGCGHPATADENLQKDLVFSKADVSGGKTVTALLPRGTEKGAVDRLYRDIAVLAVPKAASVAPDQVIDLTNCLAEDTLTWTDAPAGEWTVVRAGFVPRIGGTYNLTGRSIDHMSRTAYDAHWQTVMMPLLNAVTPKEMSVLRGVVCDSWEAGTCTWTEGFEAEFAKRRGYSLRNWLPFKAGVVCSDAAAGERFLRDFDLTVADLITENHYAYKKEVANRSGLLAITEAAGPHQHFGDVRRMQGQADVSMGEFWSVSAHRPGLAQRYMLRDSAMAAHVYGIREVLAEAFTQVRTHWTNRPRDLKTYADRAFCDGLTRVCYHGFDGAVAELPRRGVISRGAGMHYNPQLTWFEQSSALNLYLARCSWMCSQGVPVADCLLYVGDGKGVLYGMRRDADGLGQGYDYDVAPTELLLAARVENGAIVLPSGARYRTLFVSDRNPASSAEMGAGGARPARTYPPVKPFLRAEAVAKLTELEKAGATILRTRKELERFVASGNLAPDFIAHGVAADAVGWVHRALPEGEIYFVANLTEAPLAFEAEFREGKGPAALWDAVTGTRATGETPVAPEGCATGETPVAPEAHATGKMPVAPGGRATGKMPVAPETGRVKLDLPAGGSVFVVFGAGEVGPERASVVPALDVAGPWRVTFDSELGGPDEPIVTTNLFDWTASSVEGVRYYSGTAVYRTEFDFRRTDTPVRSVFLDLGDLSDVAEVILNGRNLGVAWTPPFRLPVGSALREGRNELEVRITNRWFNRFVLDETRPLEDRIVRPAKSKNADKPVVTKPGDRPFRSGLFGPVRILRADEDHQLHVL